MQAVDGGLDPDDVEWVQLSGGPCDGRMDRVASDAAALQVIMTDGQHHRYHRTEVVRQSDGRRVVVFEWEGRRFGPT